MKGLEDDTISGIAHIEKALTIFHSDIFKQHNTLWC